MRNDATELAEKLLRKANALQTPRERRRFQRIAALIEDPAAKAMSMLLTDRLFRSANARRAGIAFRDVLRRTGLPHGFPWLDRAALAIGGVVSRILPEAVFAGVSKRLRDDSSEVILPAESDRLTAFLARRAAAGTRVNLNPLGEAILGEDEAGKRLGAVLALLERPDVDYVSVKISAIYSQISIIDFDGSRERIKERLRRLYRAALPLKKFVNLDMEEYRDLALTMAVFQETLDEPEFQAARAGIVLQAYLPDSWDAQRALTAWARRRVERGGEAPKLRIVKGANLAMERVEAELHGWNAAPYTTKAETDANFKRMLDFGCRPENARALRLGVGSHNLFDVALALRLREETGIEDRVEIEMLEGMANHQARAVREAAGGLLVYAPVVHREDFGSALAYLIRRLDENTSPENFLHDLFGLAPGTPAWDRQQARFEQAWDERATVTAESRRATLPPRDADIFTNEPDTDWTQARHRDSLQKALAAWGPVPPPAPGDLATVMETARRAQPGWEALGESARAAVLLRCADVMAARRFETIACLRDDGKKAAGEADPEISEAIDFARYYARHAAVPSGLRAAALGTVVITPPWNFPYAIPCGGVLAALVAGNAVILKPAPQTVATAWLLAQQLWDGGVPRDVLQFFPCADGDVGRALIEHPQTAAVVLTGAYETARMFQSWRPSLRLYAETSGKNAIVVSALADRDLAAKDIVRSAFGHSGQKCSAASLAILEAEVYDSAAFRNQLRDAAASLAVGPSSDPANVVTPLVQAPSGSLLRALTTLDAGEEWLLEPRQISSDPCLWSPGIKLGVAPGSWFHQTECFGPALGLMRANDLDHALELQNTVAFGLTAGFHSLEEPEIEQWRERVQAGNLYINRAITGAIVQRQPFGGWKRSCIGPGSKAGGPNYVNLFRTFSEIETAPVEKAFDSYKEAWGAHFARANDPAGLRCESNVLRYRACRGVVLRLKREDPASAEMAVEAARLCGAILRISVAEEESDAAFIARMSEIAKGTEFLRTVEAPSDAVLAAAHEAGLNWIDAPISACGRIELPRWLREQAVSETRHRYGQIVEISKGGH